MKKKKRKLKKGSIIFPIVVLCIGIGLYFYYTRPEETPNKENKIEETKKEKISKADQEFNYLKNIQK